MVTFAQAQERAERWVNASVAPDARRAVVVREFDLGFVAWAEGPAGHPTGGRLVIARDSGETTLWPALPVDDVIDAYLARYVDVPEAPEPEQEPPAIDLEATSFLLTPPQWLQEAADRAGIPDNRPEDRTGPPADDDEADGPSVVGGRDQDAGHDAPAEEPAEAPDPFAATHPHPAPSSGGFTPAAPPPPG
ncbi:hypothetical protein HCJ92_20395, partial [Streptomyces sp. ventii]|nr:hypothetical protein [Streptomyces spiramenti]